MACPAGKTEKLQLAGRAGAHRSGSLRRWCYPTRSSLPAGRTGHETEDVAHRHGAKSAHTLTRPGSSPSSGSRVDARENFAYSPHCVSIAKERGVVRLQTFIAERRRAFVRVVPLTAIERFWPASYGSLQWKDSLPGWTVGSRRSWW